MNAYSPAISAVLLSSRGATEKRGHIQKREALITLNLGFQYEPSVGWVVSAFGLIGEGKTMDDAVADIQAKITKAGW